MIVDPEGQQRGWFKSSYSNGSCSCVEVRIDDGEVLIRDSKYLRDPANDASSQPIINVATGDWLSFLGQVANGT